MSKLCVIETNEVPRKVWARYVQEHPRSTLARLFDSGKQFQTVADDVDADFLYPSQTWASLNTGLPYKAHKIHWYNDPKTDQSQFWWHDAVKHGYSVGMVNVLHSSPLDALNKADSRYSFLVPDCFTSEPKTYPDKYQDFQRLNLAMVEKNGRATMAGWGDFARFALKAALRPSSFGLGAFTVSEGVRLARKALQSRERLRNMQFPTLGTIFIDLMRKADPDIGVLFTNHVAAAQHRYWYALFPEDYAEKLYDDTWVRKYERDILDAVGMLDRYLRVLADYCLQTDRTLIIVSSMGQHANSHLRREYVRTAAFDYRLGDPLGLAHVVLGSGVKVKFERAMVPQYTYEFEDGNAAVRASAVFKEWIAGNPALQGGVDINGGKATLSVVISGDVDVLQVGGKQVALKQLGFVKFPIEDHHSGRHQPHGFLLVWNDKRDELFSKDAFGESFSYLQYAQELRRHLNIKKADHVTKACA